MDLRKLDIFWIAKLFFGGILLFFIYLLLLITAQYIPLRYDVAFLAMKEVEIQYFYYKLAFFTHVYTSWIVILIGFFQFWKYLRINYTRLHRFAGKVYIFVILILAGPSGLVMSIVANGGWSAQLAFTVLSVLWINFTWKAFRFALIKNWEKHENYMIYSYALTLSAVTLRLLKYIIAYTLQLPPMDIYRFIAWAGWIINLVLAYIIILRRSYIYNKFK